MGAQASVQSEAEISGANCQTARRAYRTSGAARSASFVDQTRERTANNDKAKAGEFSFGECDACGGQEIIEAQSVYSQGPERRMMSKIMIGEITEHIEKHE